GELVVDEIQRDCALAYACVRIAIIENIIPAVVFKAALEQGSAHDVLHLVLAHAGLQLRNLAGGQHIALAYPHAIEQTTGGQAEREQKDSQDSHGVLIDW